MYNTHTPPSVVLENDTRAPKLTTAEMSACNFLESQSAHVVPPPFLDPLSPESLCVDVDEPSSVDVGVVKACFDLLKLFHLSLLIAGLHLPALQSICRRLHILQGIDVGANLLVEHFVVKMRSRHVAGRT